MKLLIGVLMLFMVAMWTVAPDINQAKPERMTIWIDKEQFTCFRGDPPKEIRYKWAPELHGWALQCMRGSFEELDPGHHL